MYVVDDTPANKVRNQSEGITLVHVRDSSMPVTVAVAAKRKEMVMKLLYIHKVYIVTVF